MSLVNLYFWSRFHLEDSPSDLGEGWLTSTTFQTDIRFDTDPIFLNDNLLCRNLGLGRPMTSWLGLNSESSYLDSEKFCLGNKFQLSLELSPIPCLRTQHLIFITKFGAGSTYDVMIKSQLETFVPWFRKVLPRQQILAVTRAITVSMPENSTSDLYVELWCWLDPLCHD